MDITHDYAARIDYDLWSNVSSFPKVKESNIDKEHIEKIKYQLIHGHEKPYEPSIYYPIVADAWERFTNGQ